MGRARRWLYLGLAVAGLVGCSTTATTPPPAGLMVIISTNLAPAEFDAIEVEVAEAQGDGSSQWHTQLDEVKAVPGAVQLPTTVFVETGTSVDEDALIQVTALLHGKPVVLRQAQVPLPTDRVAEVRLDLVEACKGQVQIAGSEGEPAPTCAVAGQSCQPVTGTCGNSVVPTAALPTYAPGDEAKDAGIVDYVTSDGSTGDATSGSSGGSGSSSGAGSSGSSSDGGTSDADATTQSVSDAGEDAADATEEGEPSACTNCTVSASDCASGGGALQTCELVGGCTQWVTSACGAHQTCTSTGSSASCTCNSSICSESGTTCEDIDTVADCEVDGNGCAYVESTTTCTSPESCSGMEPAAACSLTCTSRCANGDTACVSGGLATCMLGSNGCWAYATPVACLGSNQSCTGPSGAAACTCNASVCSSLAHACDSSDVASCAEDAYGCYYEMSLSSCSIGCHGGVCDVCSGSAQQCSGNTPQTCVAGQWTSGTACSGNEPVCSNGVCGCTPGVTQCASGTAVQTCTSSNTWGTAWTCATGACTAGACTGETTSGQSCQGVGDDAGLTNCGASNESCCSSLEVPGGSYYRTYVNGGTGPSGEADPASVSGFRLDKYQVTVGRFRQFVEAWNGGAGYTPPAGSGIHAHLNGGQGLVNSASDAGVTYETGWNTTWSSCIAPTDSNLLDCGGSSANVQATWTDPASTQENLPINCVSWFEAYAFCIWDGGFLATDAEWGYAAAGGGGSGGQREFPWGSTVPGTACPGSGCEYANYNCDYPSGSGTCVGNTNIAPVGTATLGAGLWGQLDMAGGLWQRTMDSYAATYADPCTDCAYLATAPTCTAGATGVIRGGSFQSSASLLLPTIRHSNVPWARVANIGFRCARAP